MNQNTNNPYVLTEVRITLENRLRELEDEKATIERILGAMNNDQSPQKTTVGLSKAPKAAIVKTKGPKKTPAIPSGYMTSKSKLEVKQRVIEVIGDQKLTSHEIEDAIYDKFNLSVEGKKLNRLLGQFAETRDISFKKDGNRYIYFIPSTAQ